jgi:GT2 family glycosyltransferase
MIRRSSAIDTVILHQSTEPRCSVVVLAWRLADELLEALRSLTTMDSPPPFETIVVLNGATSEVRQAISQSVEGAVIVDLDENVGFGGGCNAGAHWARGEYVVFLNDDAVVATNWLSELVDAADAHPRAKAVSSLLLNGDGSVQEAGSRMLSDAGTVQFGRGLSLDQAQAGGLLSDREIDYGSAAALLVRTSDFREVAGFDPVFEPAYYEDVDLQFRLRSLGGDVRLASNARVTHLSGRSTSDSHLFREWAASKAGATFANLWSDVLDQAPAADTDVAQLCPIPVDKTPGVAARGRQLPSASDIAAGSVATALSISRQYSAWASDHLERNRAALAIEQKEIARARERITELEADLALIRGRLADLDQRGPLGIVKWQAGLLSERRRAKKG